MQSLTNPALTPPEAPHAEAKVLFNRDGMKASHLLMPAGTELPEHTVPGDVAIVVVRGKGVVYVQQEPRHVEAGDVVDLIAFEEHSIEAIDELELVIVQAALLSRPPVPPQG